MTDQELAAIEARQRAATPPGRIIFESDIISKDVPALIQQVRDAHRLIFDLRAWVSKYACSCNSRPHQKFCRIVLDDGMRLLSGVAEPPLFEQRGNRWV